MIKYLNYVNIKKGTKSEFRYSNGNTLPLVQRPFGMAHVAIQTKGGDAWWYDPDAKYIEGLRITNQSSPWLSDYGTVLISPQADVLFENYGNNWSACRSENTKMAPHFLHAEFLRQRCTLEAAVSERCVKIRAEFGDIPKRAISIFNIMENSAFEVKIKNGAVYLTAYGIETGIAKNFKRFYVVRPLNGCIDLENSLISKNACHLMLSGFGAELNISVSYISFEQAELNMREINGKILKDVQSESEQLWENYLSKIKLNSSTDESVMKTFYSCMYRTATFPNIAYEYDKDGNAVHYSPYTGDVQYGVRYANNGF